MPTLILDSDNRIFGTSSDTLTSEDTAPNKILDINKIQFDALPERVVDYPHRWNATTSQAEVIFNLDTFRTKKITDINQQYLAIRISSRFSSDALGQSYDYDANMNSLMLLLAAAVSRDNANLTTYSGDIATDRNHSPNQLRSVARSYFDHIASLDSRLSQAKSLINSRTIQTTIESVSL
jgi:hypothetical protein